ncbi:HER208Cp [Eremothecium sinecaudum]|uniref:Mannosyl-oligosaccharide glucosidase n=1 Tax=Eremothecium sinecaudum TaxID=45286 RepID=A0A0X8HU48_9SACH|nr:HER208Cp [Eremothecium sinecaudum]AMD21486.1 HER208Cp [Eremothecium sinecaudum]
MVNYRLIALCGAILSQLLAFAYSSSEMEEFERRSNQSLLWAPYRANCYLGVRPRYVSKTPFIMGLMWTNTGQYTAIRKLRHLVDMGDNMEKYGWELYDPRMGGKQVILDTENNMNLTIYFVKSHNGENWGFRVVGDTLKKEKGGSSGSIVYYMNQNGDSGRNYLLARDLSNDNVNMFQGVNEEMGHYEVKIVEVKGTKPSGNVITADCDPSKSSHLSITIPNDEAWKAKDVFQMLISDSIQDHITNLRDKMTPSVLPSAFTLRNFHKFPPGRFHFIQKTYDISKGPFEVDFIYNKVNTKERIESLDHLISSTMDRIRNKFEKKFTIKDPKYEQFAVETLSNLLGGLSYFHGDQYIDRTSNLDEDSFEKFQLEHSELEGPAELFSFVPSRASYPRGFYWDEGFHLLQVMQYDFDLAFEVLKSWLNLIEDESGWIPREVILGNEARVKVPKEFLAQSPHVANPPTLALAFSNLLQMAHAEPGIESTLGEIDIDMIDIDDDILKKNFDLLAEYSEGLYSKLLKNFNWFRKTQGGMVYEYLDLVDLEGKTIHEEEGYRWLGRTYNHCLPSGLDDYPRPSPPDIGELHVDALSWVGIMARSLKQIAGLLGKNDDSKMFAKIESNVIDNLESLHWSAKDNSYCDLSIDDDNNVRKFTCHEGYVTLMPFALKLIPRENSERLRAMVDLMSDPERLYTQFGLLSLSKKDEFYETGEVYWRGPIWINMNYLCLDALKHYFGPDSAAAVDKELQQKAKSLYRDLRANLLNNVVKWWRKKGYCFEQYNQKTGEGQQAQHFTGWSALAVNLAGVFPETL